MAVFISMNILIKQRIYTPVRQQKHLQPQIHFIDTSISISTVSLSTRADSFNFQQVFITVPELRNVISAHSCLIIFNHKEKCLMTSKGRGGDNIWGFDAQGTFGSLLSDHPPFASIPALVYSTQQSRLFKRI